jgi:predicted GIY-YIG superfamily endonuclease
MSTSPGVIYVIENRVNHKVYVGQTTMSFKRRLWIHAHSSKGIFGNAIRKHGIVNFSIKVMACSECHMDWMERE